MKKISKSKIFLFFLIAFLVGVFWASLFEINIYFKGLLWVLTAVSLSLCCQNKKNILVFFTLVGFLFGVGITEKELEKIYPREEIFFQGSVLVDAIPKIKDDYQQLVVCPKKEENFDCKEKYIINTMLYPKYEYGEILNIRCGLKNPENKYEKFDYIRFLAKSNVYQICKNAKIEKNENIKTKISWRKKAVQKTIWAREKMEEKINLLFSQPEGGYLGGLLLGGDDRLPKETAENFRRTGTTHTVAVSGYNITILAQFLMIFGIMLGFWRQKAFYLAVVGIAFFVLMIGSPTSATRAGVMGFLILWANKNGRLANSYRAIVLAGAIMTFFSPLILVYDVGFQLSFLATLAIVLIYGPLAEKMEIKNDFLGIKSILWVTISAQIGVLGILIYNFETFSLVSLLANMVILPLVPILMLGGFVVVIVGFIFMPLAKILALPVWAGLHLEIKAIEYLAKVPWAILEIENMSWIWLAGYYLFFFLLVLKLKKNK